jgi:hypothetical protein
VIVYGNPACSQEIGRGAVVDLENRGIRIAARYTRAIPIYARAIDSNGEGKTCVPVSFHEAGTASVTDERRSDHPHQMRWAAYAGGGGDLGKFQQTGVFGGGDANLSVPGLVSVGLSGARDSWGLGFDAEYYSPNVTSMQNGVSEDEHRTFFYSSLRATYRGFYAGLSVKIAPFGVIAGYDWFEPMPLVPQDKYWRLNCGFQLGYAPINQSANLNSPGTTGGITGSSTVGIAARAGAKKPLAMFDEDLLLLDLELRAALDSTSLTGTWSGASGTTTRTLIEAAPQVLLEYQF